jgi:VIT1/CCC1 family predicted Fe2+/Mn2+ transporter
MAPVIGGVIMFVSFVIAGFIPLVPYLFVSGYSSLIISITISLVALGILGYGSAKVTKARPWKRTFRMIILGGSAILIGAMVSFFVKIA